MNGPVVTLTDIDEFLGAMQRDAQHGRIVSNEIYIQCNRFEESRWSARGHIYASYLRKTGVERWDRLILSFRAYAAYYLNGGVEVDPVTYEPLQTEEDIAKVIKDAAEELGLIVQQGAVAWDVQ